MGAHDETRWSDAHLRAFETFVKGQSRALALLRAAAARDEACWRRCTRLGTRDSGLGTRDSGAESCRFTRRPDLQVGRTVAGNDDTPTES